MWRNDVGKCAVTFVAGFSAHDVAKVLLDAPSGTTMHGVREHDFGRDLLLILESDRFVDGGFGVFGWHIPVLVARFEVDEDMATTVRVPWPLKTPEPELPE